MGTIAVVALALALFLGISFALVKLIGHSEDIE